MNDGHINIARKEKAIFQKQILNNKKKEGFNPQIACTNRRTKGIRDQKKKKGKKNQ